MEIILNETKNNESNRWMQKFSFTFRFFDVFIHDQMASGRRLDPSKCFSLHWFRCEKSRKGEHESWSTQLLSSSYPTQQDSLKRCECERKTLHLINISFDVFVSVRCAQRIIYVRPCLHRYLLNGTVPRTMCIKRKTLNCHAKCVLNDTMKR